MKNFKNIFAVFTVAFLALVSCTAFAKFDNTHLPKDDLVLIAKAEEVATDITLSSSDKQLVAVCQEFLATQDQLDSNIQYLTRVGRKAEARFFYAKLVGLSSGFLDAFNG